MTTEGSGPYEASASPHPPLARLSDWLAPIQHIFLRRGYAQTWLGGSSARELLDAILFDEPLALRDIDLYLVRDGSAGDLHGLCRDIEQGGHATIGRIREKRRANPDLAGDACYQHVVGEGAHLHALRHRRRHAARPQPRGRDRQRRPRIMVPCPRRVRASHEHRNARRPQSSLPVRRPARGFRLDATRRSPPCRAQSSSASSTSGSRARLASGERPAVSAWTAPITSSRSRVYRNWRLRLSPAMTARNSRTAAVTACV